MQSVTAPRPRVKSARKPLAPVQVTGSLITGLGTGLADLFDGCAILEIDDARELTSYWCSASTDVEGRITGLHIQKFATGEKYDLPATLDDCDCPDAIYRSHRPGGCRHQVALRQALVSVVRDNAPAPLPRPDRKSQRDEQAVPEAA